MVDAFALYVHWPWCVRKCPYCDFNSHAITREVDEAAYIDALLDDLEGSSELSGERTVTSVFFGGGTPSLMTPTGFYRLMSGIGERVKLSEDCEITMEANPGTLEQNKFKSFADAGVNRFSIGIQSFDDVYLKRLGRIHTAAQAHQAVEAALRCVDNVNLDVMYALPGQSLADMQKDVNTALSKGTTHLSFYELTIEEGTAFAKRVPENLPEGDDAADMSEWIWKATKEAGFEHYEISGYAKPQRRCLHNLTYWTFGDYLGIGAGAHGKITRNGEILRTIRRANPFLYMDDAAQRRFPTQVHSVQTCDYAFEFMLNALRLLDGVPTRLWEQRTGLPLSTIASTLQELKAEGLLVNTEERIVATELGQRFLSDIQERFLSTDVDE